MILIVIALSSSAALAIPGGPNVFYGSVTWNGQSAPDGTTITAKINGVQVASTTTSGGKYGYPIATFYVDDPNNDRTGQTINFFVNGVDTGVSAGFCNFCFNLCGTNPNCTTLDLSATGTAVGQATVSGGGGGGSSTQTTTTTTTTTTTNQTTGTTQQGCQEKWICGDWGTCQNGVETRTCSDVNKCGTNSNEPFSSQPCSAAEREQSQQQAQATSSLTGPLTAFFLSLTTTEWAGAIVAGIVIAALVIFFVYRKNPHKIRSASKNTAVTNETGYKDESSPTELTPKDDSFSKV